MARKRAATQFSGRWDRDVVERLQRQADAAGLNKSRLAQRYVDEGIRIDQHPGIVFRDGPASRRAALAAGPDVWEVISTLQESDRRGDAAVSATAELLGLPAAQVRVAVRYYAAYPDEVDERIRRNLEQATEAEQAWRREQAALA